MPHPNPSGRPRNLRMLSLATAAFVSAAWTVSVARTDSPTNTANAASAPDTSTQVDIPSVTSSEPLSISKPTPSAQATITPAANVVGDDIPAAALSAYQRAATIINAAQPACSLRWALVAAIGKVESNHGRTAESHLDDEGRANPAILGPALTGLNGTSLVTDTDAGQYDGNTEYDRAVGPMQILPTTWPTVRVDADGDGKRDPQDIDDASLASAVYLCANDADLSTAAGEQDALLRYNTSPEYAAEVTRIADRYDSGSYATTPNDVMAAAYLSPAQTSPIKISKPDKATAAAPTTEAGPSPAVPDDEPAAGPAAPSPATEPEAKHALPLPKLPNTNIKPVDKLLTTTQAVLQCTLDGLLNNPLAKNDSFDQCVTKLTTSN